MYSQLVINHHLKTVRDKLKLSLKYHPAGRIADLTAHLSSIYDGAKGKLKRPLTAEESAFVRNEQLLCKFDFLHWATSYGTIEYDGAAGGGIGLYRPWESQRLVIERIARCEADCFEMFQKGESAPGVRIVNHKSRQLGATMLGRLFNTHRLTTWSHARSIGASIDTDKVFELYRRDKTIYDNLPWFLKPSVEFDVKSEHLAFSKLKSFCLYQENKQQSGLGQGRQFDLAHLTECASWPYPEVDIELDFFPTLPLSPWTLCLLESTARGRGNWWHNFSEDVRKGHHPMWIYIFVPWYAEPKKYRLTPPEGWVPSDLSMQHAQKVHETSHEFVGRAVMLPKDQLYWYETSRAQAQRGGTLNLFLSNFCATPEESFQHSNVSAFSAETLDSIRLATSKGVTYEFIGGDDAIASKAD